MAIWVLGDQLTHTHGPLNDDTDERVLMIEARAFARRHAYHPHKLTMIFSAMRHFRDELREAGRTVEYYRTETFGEGLEQYFETYPDDELVIMEPASHGAADSLRALVTNHGGTLNVTENELFLCSPDMFDTWAGDPPYRQENFYRMMRRDTGYLMEGGDPLGGEWNYDDENQQFPGSDYEPPAPPRFEPDETTEAVET